MSRANFLEIPNEVDLVDELPPQPTVESELDFVKKLLATRLPKCKPITEQRQQPKPVRQRRPHRYRKICVCPRYNPNYLCNHTGNVIIDRDVLSKREHLCYLAAPKVAVAPPHGPPRYYRKRSTLPGRTSRIDKLAQPALKYVRENIRDFKRVLTPQQLEKLKELLKPTVGPSFFDIPAALTLMAEQKRLERGARRVEKRRCRKIIRCIRRKQRQQMRKIIHVVFEEMKEFLLNDQFLFTEPTPLSTIILKHLHQFTAKEFHSSSNLREFQEILANNISVWINKFISNMRIHVARHSQPAQANPENTDFLSVADYLTCSESDCEDGSFEAEASVVEEDFGGEAHITDAVTADMMTGRSSIQENFVE